MLTIRSSQMAVLAKSLVECFVEGEVQRLRSGAWTDAALRAWVERVIGIAQAHGFTTADHTRRFIDLAAVHCEEFVCSGWARPILQELDMTPEWRLNRLEEAEVFVTHSAR